MVPSDVFGRFDLAALLWLPHLGFLFVLFVFTCYVHTYRDWVKLEKEVMQLPMLW